MPIEFTQYMRPHGYAKTISTKRPEEIEAKASILRASGYVFEAEVLTTGQVSLTVETEEDGPTVAIEVVSNGSDVPAAVDRLILAAFERGKVNGV